MALVALFFVAAATDHGIASERGKGGTLRLLYWQAPTIVNPHLSVGNKDLSASRIVYEPLASFDSAGNLVLILAAEEPSLANGGVAADGRSVTWKLKPDVKWADGTSFTAEDVRFTFDYATNPAVAATSSATFADVERVEVIDAHTVKLHFRGFNPAWATAFIGQRGGILPEHIFAPYNGANAKEAPANRLALGTGPYMVREFNEEDILIIGDDVVSTIKIEYEINPFFRNPDQPHFSTVELRGGGDAKTAAVAVLKEGSVDYSSNLQIPIEELDALEALGHGRANIPATSWVERIMLNFADPNQETDEGERASVEFPHPVLSDRRVRQAIAYGVDRAAISALYGRTGPLTTNLVVSPIAFASPNTGWEFNLDKAAALLDEAGWTDSDGDGFRDKDGMRLRLVFQTSVNRVRQKTQEIVTAALERIGVEIEIKTIDASVYFGPVEDSTNTRRHFYADLEMFAFNNKVPDPQSYLAAWTCAEAAQKANNWSGTNWSRYCNPEFDALWEKAARELDPQKRRALVIAMNDLLIDDVAVIPLVERPAVEGVSNSIEGVVLTPWDVELWNIHEWRRR